MATIPDSITPTVFAAPPVQAAVGARALRTIADVLNLFPGMPPERIRLSPVPGTATEADVIALDDHEDCLCELIDGILIQKTMGYYESQLASAIIQILGTYCDEYKLGTLTAPDGPFRLRPGLVRMPDVAFVSWARIPDSSEPREPVANFPPDLAIEVLSRSNPASEMTQKLLDYFEGGVQLVWYVDPIDRTIRSFTSPTDVTVLSANDMLEGGTVVPGFAVKVDEIFARVEKPQ